MLKKINLCKDAARTDDWKYAYVHMKISIHSGTVSPHVYILKIYYNKISTQHYDNIMSTWCDIIYWHKRCQHLLMKWSITFTNCNVLKPSSHIHDLVPRLRYDLSRLDKSWVVVGMYGNGSRSHLSTTLHDCCTMPQRLYTTGYEYTTTLVPIHHDPIPLATTASWFHYACTPLTTTHDDSITTPLRLLTMSQRWPKTPHDWKQHSHDAPRFWI